MKIKVGQYFRNHKNEILEIIEIVNTNGKWVTNDLKRTYHIGEIKVADTPQELIKVGDLISCSRYYDLLSVIDEEDLETLLEKYWQPFITKILTPNSNGGYDLQWEAE